MNELLTKQIQAFINFIDKNILKDMLIYEYTDFEKKVKIQKESVLKEQKKITKDSVDAQLMST
jgi:hypothetical protein